VRRVRLALGATSMVAFSYACPSVAVAQPDAPVGVPLPITATLTVDPLYVYLAAPAVLPTRYQVVPGDTLSALAIRFDTNLAALITDNHISDPNLIMPGQVLQITSGRFLAGSPPSGEGSASPRVTGGYESNYRAPAVASYSGGSSFQSCVEFRESTDGAGSSNLYGILPSTWSANGFVGSPYTASPAAQAQAFNTIYSREGSAPWAPYDGC
jgi:LysM repeat protein